MAPFNLRHLFRSRQFTRPSTPSGRRRVRPQLEFCEDRTLLATFNVTDFNDVVNLNDGKWSLREAVNAANANNEEDTIILQEGLYVLTQGELSLTSSKETTINGANTGINSSSTISGNGKSRVLAVSQGATATLMGLTITGGYALQEGGGIHSQGNLTLNTVAVTGNRAQGRNGLPATAGQGAFGGGIYNGVGGVLTIYGSDIRENQSIGGKGGDAIVQRIQGTNVPFSATSAGIGGQGWAGGVANLGTVEIYYSTLTNNTAMGGLGGSVPSDVVFVGLASDRRATGGQGLGGALATATGPVKINFNSVLSDNTAQGGIGGGDGLGGAIYIYSGTVTLNGDVLRNAARGGVGEDGPTSPLVSAGDVGGSGEGGGIFLLSGTLNINRDPTDATVVGIQNNRAIGGNGGAGGQGYDGARGRGSFQGDFFEGSIGNPGLAGGPAGSGGAGGFAGGGGIFLAGGQLNMTDFPLSNNIVVAGAGGKGGDGGVGGTGASEPPSEVWDVKFGSVHGGDGGRGGSGGRGGAGGYATGGGLAQSNGESVLTQAIIENNTTTAGSGGDGGRGGHGGNGGDGHVDGPFKHHVDELDDIAEVYYMAMNGGHGAAAGAPGGGGKGGEAGGGGVAVGGGTLRVERSSIVNNVATAGNGGAGATGADGGQGGDGGVEADPEDVADTGFTLYMGFLLKNGGIGIGGRGAAAGSGGFGGDGGRGAGGGIYLIKAVPDIASTATIVNSTIDGNQVFGGAGGNAGNGGVGGKGGDGTYESVLSGGAGGSAGVGGSAGEPGDGGSAQGGGLFNDNASVTLQFATITSNQLTVTNGGTSATGGRAGIPGTGGSLGGRDGSGNIPGQNTRSPSVRGTTAGAGVFGPATITSNIVALGLSRAPGMSEPQYTEDLAGAFVSGGGNLIGDIGSASGVTQSTDQRGSGGSRLDPLLNALDTTYGGNGRLKARSLASNSPAKDKGVAVAGISVDQLGVARPGGAGPDAGSLEFFSSSVVSVSNVRLPSRYSIEGPEAVVAGVVNTYTVRALDAGGTLVTNYNGGIGVATTDPQGLVPSRLQFVAGIATFSVTLKTAGTQALIIESVPLRTSRLVSVNPAAAASLQFETQPSYGITLSPISPSVTVKAFDPFGNLATSSTNLITLALDYNPTNAKLLNATASLVNGVASFPNLSVDRPSGRYTLAASGVGTVIPKSSDFAVAPAIVRRATGSATVNQGTPYTLALEATGGTIQTWTINWGDGTTENFPGSATSAVHTFTTPVTRTITVSATDTDGVVRQAVYNRRNYIADFQGGSPASGWSYLWNKNGPIGTPANYVPLVWSPTVYSGTYVVDEGQWPSSGPGSFALLGPNWGHPGAGSGQGVGYDRTVIAAFTAPQDGTYRIMDGTIDRNSGAVNGSVEVYIYKNSTLLRRLSDITGPNSWSSDPVTMAAGDTLYAAVGPQGGDGHDTFQWDFAVARTDGMSVTVANVAPVVSPPAPQGFTPGTPTLFSLGSFTDVTGDGPWSVRVAWGDSGASSIDTFNVTSPGTLPLRSHTYAGEGPYVVQVVVSDTRNGAKSSVFQIGAFTRVTIDKAPGQADPTSNSPIVFNVSFSKPVVDFSPASVRLSGSALPTTVTGFSGGGRNFMITVAGMTRRGDVIATVPAEAATDFLGVKTLASTSTDNTVGFNRSPSVLNLGGGTIAENSPGGTVVGTLTSSDPDIGDSATYSLVNDAGRFMLIGDKLIVRSGPVLDFEATPTINIAARVTDGGGLTLTRNFVVNLTNVNEAPTSLNMSGGTIAENSPAGTLVGTLSSTDPDAGDTATYSLLDDAGGRFVLVGDKIHVKTGAVLDFETTPTLNITARVTDTGGLTLTRDFTISLINVNEKAAFVVQKGETQRSLVRMLTLDFDGGAGLDTLLAPGRITLTRIRPDGVTETVPLAGLVTLVGNRLAFDFGKTGLADGRYTLAVDADGDGVQETTRSFHRLFGDSDGDGDVDAADYRVFLAAYKRPTVYAQYWYFDADGDGIISEADLLAFRSRFGTRI